MKKNNNETIGIIGQGFVGGAIYHNLKSKFNILTYDIDKSKCNSTLMNVLENCTVIFLCLPTPMYKTGKCDISIVENTIFKINQLVKNTGIYPGFGQCQNRPIIIIKSTIPPGTTEYLDNKYNNIDIVFSPEFLTEANNIQDFANQNRVIIGGKKANDVSYIFEKSFNDIPIIITTSKEAEMVKYFINCFLATKVSFANEIYHICEILDIDYQNIIKYVLLDKRIGNSHLLVPGPDGDRGYGGHCFPKDIASLIFTAKKYNYVPKILEMVTIKNNQIRKNKDWLKMVGRAVSND